jgi:gamma-tubulin complex component 3
VNIFYKKFKLNDNLNSIDRYLLVDQGDMMQYLMDLLFNELKMAATQIYRHNLLNILETANSASDAQYHHSDCLKRLYIKLLNSNTGDKGWDNFVVE